ncbi:MAG TPA: LLM class flavin-dependent oxidoreductase [Solirubrobacteraceae bacterium]|nr:LLM class flavin-dependent oxidoreductase [Solirubrobacteraceae bacterium]
MIELGILNNGNTDLPVYQNPDGIYLTEGGFQDSFSAMQRVLRRQINQGVLADKLGYDYFFLTEHHFQPEGAEHSPNPMMVEAAVAVLTERIRLGQMANIIPWHHPLRLAEQASMLDIMSDGRLEFGIGRGYQAREAEVLGRPYGAGVQDNEANRALFEESYQLLIKAFTQESFSHRGEFYTVPPSYVNWHHPQTIAYYQQEAVNRTVEQVMNIGQPTGRGGVTSATTTLKEITVGPQPLQKPYPQIWMPMTTKRSAEWAASNGVNGIYAATPNNLLEKELDIYHHAARNAGWPDRLERGEFKRGWDAERKRGVVAVRMVHVVEGELGDAKLYDKGLNLNIEYMKVFGALGVQLAHAGFDEASTKSMSSSGLNLIGSPGLVLDAVADMKTAGKFDDMMILLVFDMHSLPEQMVNDQMQYFSEEIMPVLHKEYGRKADEPALYPAPAPRLPRG